jgi:hypothetical protein
MYIPPLGVKEKFDQNGKNAVMYPASLSTSQDEIRALGSLSSERRFTPMKYSEFPKAGSTVFLIFSSAHSWVTWAAGASLVLTAAKNCRNASGVTAAHPYIC